MSLTEIATTDVITASPDDEIRSVLEQMRDESVGSVVVTDDGPVGIVTDRMIAMAAVDADSMDDLTTEDVMTGDPITIDDDATHFEAFETMSDEGIRRLPIVDDGELVGIVTLDDLLTLTATELSYASDVIEQQSGSH